MKRSLLIFLIALVAVSLPTSLFAGSCAPYGTPQDFGGVVCVFIDLVSTAIPIVAGLALLVFFWGLAKFILKSSDETAREEGKEVMKWGIVALFVMVSVWGIVLYLHGDIFSDSPTPLSVPLLPIGSN